MGAATLKLGLTGGIGSGKSTVATLLAQRGAVVIDADRISRASTATGGSAITAIAQSFGKSFITSDGALDRERMRTLVFEKPSARAQLEGIVHPLIALEIQRQAAAARSGWLVFDVPLLVESPRWRPQLDRILVVDCTEATQIRRVQARNGWDLATIDNVMRSQSPRQQRLAGADMVIFNDGNEMEQLQRTVDQLASRFGL
jgi:dephospho-CoA kinase